MSENKAISSTVIKFTKYFDLEYYFIKVLNKSPREVKEILEEYIKRNKNNIFEEKIPQLLETNNLMWEEVGCCDDNFPPNYPADLEFCFDTENVYDLNLS